MSQPYGPGYPQQPQPPQPMPQPPLQPPPAPAPPPAYAAPGYGVPVPVPVVKQEAPSANTAMILGIVGIAAWFLTCGVLGLIGIGGIVFAKKAEEEIARSGHMLGGEDKVKIGKITGWISTILGGLAILGWIAYFLFVAALFSATSTMPN